MKPYLILIFTLSFMLAGCSHTKVILPSQKESTAGQELERFVRQLVDDFNGGDPVVLKRNHHFPFARVQRSLAQVNRVEPAPAGSLRLFPAIACGGVAVTH